MKSINLTSEHIEIMEHTMKNGRYCGDSKEMKGLCEMGWMESMGFCSFVPDEYFRITSAGRKVLNERRLTA